MLRLVVAACTGLAPDEAYYRVWSTALQGGFLDHPPGIALLIRAGTALCGPTVLGVRLAAPLLAGSGSLLLAGAARDLAGLDRAGQGWAVLLFNATLLVGVGAVTVTPDTPLVFCWGLTLWCLGRAFATGRSRWVAAAGLALGLAFDGKYTAILLLPAIMLVFVATASGRRLLRRPGTLVGILAGLAAVAPVLAWNAAHGWASFARQGGRAATVQWGRGPRYLAELFGGQLGLVTPGIALLAVVGLAALARAARRGDAGSALVFGSVAVPGLVFVAHAFGDRVQANWPSVLYPGLAIAAARGAERVRWRRVLIPASVLGYALGALLYAQATLRVVALSPRFDVTAARLDGWPALARAVASADGACALPVAVPDYGLAAELAWYAPGLAVDAIGPRWRFFRLPRAPSSGRRVLLLRRLDRDDHPEPAPGFRPLPGPDTLVVRSAGPRVAARYRLTTAIVVAPPPVGAALPSRNRVAHTPPG